MRDYRSFFADAVEFFWSRRASRVAEEQTEYAGKRSEVVSGKHLDGFLIALTDLLVSEGVAKEHVFTKGTSIPGFFRACKDWDLVVIRDRQLLAAIEIKAQVGPSFGNNVNNRVEEAIGNAVDLWTAYREERFLEGPQPFVGYLFLLEETAGSMSAVKASARHFPIDPEFEGASYAKRYELLCRRLIAERHYSAATLLLSRKEMARHRPNYHEPSPELTAQRFAELLLRTVMPM